MRRTARTLERRVLRRGRAEAEPPRGRFSLAGRDMSRSFAGQMRTKGPADSPLKHEGPSDLRLYS